MEPPSGQISRFVIEASTGDVLFDEGADVIRGPASLTKMALLYVAFDALSAGLVHLDDVVTISPRARTVRGSVIGLQKIMSMSVRDLIASTAVCSANDTAVALAIGLSGSVAKMIRNLNVLAMRLGLKHTYFRTVSGLYRPGQVTTARDMASLGRRLIVDHPDQRHWLALRSFSFGGRLYKATNTLLGKYPGLNGIKTGTTPQDGAHLVASVANGTLEVVAVIMGTAKKKRDQEMIELLNTVFRA